MATEKIQIIPSTSRVHLSIYVIAADDPTSKRNVDLEVFECPGCKGSIGIDATYLEQVTEAIACPYCRDLLMIAEEE